MSCEVLGRGGKPAPLLHRIRCRECRAAYRADRIIALGMACLRAEPAPVDGLGKALRAVGLSPRTNVEARLRLVRFIRKARRVFCILAAPPILLGWGWLWWIDRDPNVVVPTPAMPAVNAFTYLRDAGTAIVDGSKVDWALTNRPRQSGSPGVPAAGVAGAMAPSMAGPPMVGGAASGPTGFVTAPPAVSGSVASKVVLRRDPPPADDPSKHVYTAEERAALVAENARALSLLREGLKLPYLEPPSRSFYHVFPHYAKFRGLARLLALEAQVRRARGDNAGAMASSLDAIQLGRRIQHGGTMIGKLVGLACEAIGRAQAWQALDGLSGDDARRASLRLSGVLADHVTMTQTFEEEKLAGMAGLMEIMRQRNWRMRSALVTGVDDNQRVPIDGLVFVLLLPYSKTAILDNYAAAMDWNIATAQMPYWLQKDRQMPEPRDLVNQMLYPAFSQAAFKDFENDAQNGLLQVALALRAYRAERGGYSATLSELLPRYLERVPEDPFAGHEALSYRRSGERYVLYSIGPDCQDNQGSPAVDSSATYAQAKYRVSSTSTGDIVAGVNTPGRVDDDLPARAGGD